MGQQEILDLLKKEKRWLSSEEIRKKLKKSSGSSINRALLILYKSKDIDREEKQKGAFNNNYYVYKLK